MDEQSIFTAALELQESEREAYLDEACSGDPCLRASVERLLRFHPQTGTFMTEPAAPIVAATADGIGDEHAGTQIGPYTLLKQIGEGGMGVVYRAERQTPVRREVALKIIKPGMDTRDVIARFEVERQTLAMMNHVNIAKVFGAGTTESGRPYFVMELVEGVPITEYADQNRMSVKQRLELFGSVCDAVQHAHQKGIIHRDIKPFHVIVADDDGAPTPRMIDFGIAKAIRGEANVAAVTTDVGQIIGTPMYMSLEQAGLNNTDVDTRTDIYSLGVMLYELLTGTTPFAQDRLRNANFDEVRRLIREEEPPRPSTRVSTLDQATTATVSEHRNTAPDTLSRTLRGELDWIVTRALEKDRERRYASVNSFAGDIQRYLNDETVEACPPSTAYRFHKFARRNKVVLASAFLVGMSLIAGAGVATWQSIRATRETERATRETNRVAQEQNNTEIARAESEELATLGLRVLNDIYLNVLGDRLARQQEVAVEQRQLLQKGLDYYEGFVKRTQGRSDSDLVIANAHRQIGLIYGRLGDRPKEEHAYRTAISLYEQLARHSPDEPEYEFRLALALGSLLENQAALGSADAAKESGDRAIQILERLHSKYPKQSDYGMALAGMYNRHAWELGSVLSPRETVQHHQTAIRLFRRLARAFPNARLDGELPYDDPRDGVAHSQLQLVRDAHDVEGNGPLRLAAGQHFKRKVERNPHSQWHRAQLAEVNLTLHASNEEVRRGLELLNELHSEFPSVPRYTFRLARACERLGRMLADDPAAIQEAEKNLRRAVVLMTDLVRDFPNTPDFHNHLATAFGGLMELPSDVIDLDEARRLIELAIQRQTQAVKANTDHRIYRKYLADHYSNLIVVLEQLGLSDEVDKAFTRRNDLLADLAEEDQESFGAKLLVSG